MASTSASLLQDFSEFDVFSTASSSPLSIHNNDEYDVSSTVSSSSASSVQKRFKYDVFLSFRGEDTRKTFVDHLYHALHQNGIITYKDDEKIQKGERIDEQIMRSIEDSRFYIIVFSKNYASSSWCLDELVKIMECQKSKEQTAYPVFYDVEPTEVRNQSGAVGEAFAKHEKEGSTRKRKRTLEDVDQEKENVDDVGRWRNAMKEAAGLAGMELKNTFNGQEAKFIQQVVQDISLKLHFINWRVDEDLVGMETRVENVVSSLEIGSEDVRMIGIKGIGGGGKTTLARAVFDHICTWFDGTSFVENVREVSKSSLSGLKELQKQVLKDVSHEPNIDVTSVFDGKGKMKKIMGSTKVLLVLDDVDNKGQLEALAGKPNWFKPGSRIIITTRDEQVLIAHRVNFIHDVNMLSDEEALCLFSRHAFEREIPIEGYEKLSETVIHYAAGLPLTIKVLGSFLCGRIECEWVDAIERLKTIPLNETLEKLEVSYNGLENDHKEIFLDVICLLKGVEKKKAIRILESCGFKALIGLRVLEQKSLITISDKEGLCFHDHIEEMGRNIVRRMHPDEPNRHSRLWIREEIKHIMVNDSGTEATRCIKVFNLDLHPTIIMKGLKNMRKLRFLYVDSYFYKWDVDEVTHYLPNALQSLCWLSYPFCHLPKTFRENKLVNLEMPCSNISELLVGGERKVLKNLRFLDLSYSMLRSFDLELTPHLEELVLNGCRHFAELHLQFECSNLKSINLSNTKVRYLNIELTPYLEELNLANCTDFEELHLPFECLNLKSIDLSGTKVSYLNIGLTPHLERLALSTCHSLQEIHAPVGCLKNLYFLDLRGCLRFQHFFVGKEYKSGAILRLFAKPVYTCRLHPNNKLPKFKFNCYYKEAIPSSSGNLEKLISFGLCACTNLESFSASICGLQHLKELELGGSIPEVLLNDLYRLESLERLSLWMEECKHLPDCISLLKNLKSLDISCERLEQFPENIYRLKCLKSLHLLWCSLLKKLPEELGHLECLEELKLRGCQSLQDIPNNICNMKCLKSLDLSHCILLERLPKELERLECLEELNLTGCKSLGDVAKNLCMIKCLKRLNLDGCILVEKLPEELGHLECLEELNLTGCKSLRDIPISISNIKCLKHLDLSHCILVEQLPEELGHLQCLEELNLTGCKSLQDIPSSICDIKCLKYLDLSYCILVEKLPEELGCLECLKELYIEGVGISGLPQSIYQLKGASIFGSREQLESYGFTSLTPGYREREGKVKAVKKEGKEAGSGCSNRKQKTVVALGKHGDHCHDSSSICHDSKSMCYVTL